MLSNSEIESNYQKFKDLLLSTNRPNIEKLIAWLDKTDLKVAPASTKFHASYEGGLVKHSLNVYEEICKMTEYIELLKIPADTLIITALLHDLCKVNFYTVDARNIKNKETGQWEQIPYYAVNDIFPIGHAEKSIIMLLAFIPLNRTEIAMIRNHMGFSRDETSEVSLLFDKYPESVLLHNADIIATYMREGEVFNQRINENA